MLLDGVCSRACATAECEWDFFDCCTPTFTGTTTSLDTHTDTTLLEIRMNNSGGSTPYDKWDVKDPIRYVANKHRLVAGVLLDQTRKKLTNCSSLESYVSWADVGIGSQVVSALTEDDATCVDVGNQVSVAGSDPVFEPRSVLYNRKLDYDTCHPNDDNFGFPFVRYPDVGDGKPLQWGQTIDSAIQEARDADFFNFTTDTTVDMDTVKGFYPLFFDVRFDHDRASKYLQYVHCCWCFVEQNKNTK